MYKETHALCNVLINLRTYYALRFTNTRILVLFKDHNIGAMFAMLFIACILVNFFVKTITYIIITWVDVATG